MENSVSQYFVSDFHSVKPGLTKHVLVVWMGISLSIQFIVQQLSLIDDKPCSENFGPVMY